MLRFILVDDDSVINFVNQKLIKRSYPYADVRIFTSGRECLEVLKDYTPPEPLIILLDLNMPGFSGWEFLEEYGKMQFPSHFYVYILSSSVDQADLAKAAENSHVLKYIAKPLKADDLESFKLLKSRVTGPS